MVQTLALIMCIAWCIVGCLNVEAAGSGALGGAEVTARRLTSALRGTTARSLKKKGNQINPKADIRPFAINRATLPPLAAGSLTSPPPLGKRPPPPVVAEPFFLLDVGVHVIKRMLAPLEAPWNSTAKQATAKTVSYICPGIIRMVTEMVSARDPETTVQALPGQRGSPCTWLRNVRSEIAVFAFVTFKISTKDYGMDYLYGALGQMQSTSDAELMMDAFRLTYIPCLSKVEVGKGFQFAGEAVRRASGADKLSKDPNVSNNEFFTSDNSIFLALPWEGNSMKEYSACTVGL